MLRGVATRSDRVIARIRAVASNVLVFAHRDILRILIVRWIALPVLEARRLDLATTSVSTLGYDHGLDEPVSACSTTRDMHSVAVQTIR